jgi:hypothetical protein
MFNVFSNLVGCLDKVLEKLDNLQKPTEPAERFVRVEFGKGPVLAEVPVKLTPEDFKRSIMRMELCIDCVMSEIQFGLDIFGWRYPLYNIPSPNNNPSIQGFYYDLRFFPGFREEAHSLFHLCGWSRKRSNGKLEGYCYSQGFARCKCSRIDFPGIRFYGGKCIQGGFLNILT